jgi:uncharacterized membrane-anchored protein
MKRVLLAAIVTLLAISAMFSIADMRVALAQESPTLDQMTEEQRIAELEAMQWIVGPGTHTLPLSHSQIELSEGQELLLGETAARYDYLTGGIETPETEAIVWNAADGALTYFSFYDIGYVTEEDWDRVDPVEFMTQIKEAGIQANVERERVGIDPFYISDWRQEPTYDAATHTAYWATDVTDIMTQWVNAVAIRLSRTGYQQVIWAGSGDDFAAAQSALGGLLGTLRYDEGYRYEDFTVGDERSGMSIGELAAATMGVEFGGGIIAAILAAVFLFMKKGGALLVAGGAVGAAVVARRKRRAAGNAPSTASPPTASSDPPPPLSQPPTSSQPPPPSPTPPPSPPTR